MDSLVADAYRLSRGEGALRRHRSGLVIVLFLFLSQAFIFIPKAAGQGQEFYVAPNGSPSGDGTRERPWDLNTALSGRKVPPGSTIWLRGGTYVGVFKSTLSGTESALIIVRGYAGERAIVSDNRERAGAGTINVMGAWTIYRDFEVTNSAPGRGASRIFRPMGFEVTGPHNKLINLVIHDTGHGMGVWAPAVGTEIYGNIIFNGGSQNELVDQGHGHGIYSQNNDGTKVIRDNVVFNQFGWGLHVWPGPGDVKGYQVEGNVFFNNGILSNPSHYDGNILINEHAPFRAERIVIKSNYTYDFPKNEPGTKFYDAGVCLACTDPQAHAGNDFVLQDNYFVGGSPVAIVGNWQDITMTGNSFVGDKGLIAFAGTKRSEARSVRWEDNQYFGRGLDVGAQRNIAFLLDTKTLPFAAWAQETGYDRNSHYSTELPTGLKIFVRPNQYEAGRANIIVYNWNHQEQVEVDLRTMLKTGDKYTVLNVQDYLGAPILSGTYDGKAVKLPMTGLSVAVPVGRSSAPRFTGPEFAVFVVRTASRASISTAGEQREAERAKTPPERSDVSSADQDLARYTGLFVCGNPPARISIRVDSGKLTATMLHEPGQPSYTLIRVSPTRFRLEGAPAGFFAEFHFSRDRITNLTFERGSFPAVHLVPQ
jgi:hypothetical protein